MVFNSVYPYDKGAHMLTNKLKALIEKTICDWFSSPTKTFRRSRLLRFEGLEPRRYLSVNTLGDAPEKSETEVVEVGGENRTLYSVISFSDAVLEEMESEELFEKASECEYVSEKTIEVTHEDTAEGGASDSQEWETQIVSFSEFCKEKLSGDTNAALDGVESQDATSGGGVVHVLAPSLVYSATGALRHVMGNEGTIAFLERSGLQGSGGFSEGESFLSVTTPALEYSFEGRITFSGSAIIGRDYDVYLSNGESLSAFNHESFTYSGGGSTLIIVPRNDNYHEPTETVEILFEEYYPYPSGGGSGGSGGSSGSGGSGGTSESDVVYEFEYETNSVSFQIIDDDQWRVEVVPGYGENGYLLEPCSGSLGLSDLSGSFKVERTLNATGKSLKEQYPDYSLDDSYQITVDLCLEGDAESGIDYEIRSDINSNRVAPTFSLGSGVTSRDIWIRTLGDSVFETDEDVRISIDDAYIGAHNYGVDIGEGDVSFTIHQAPEFVKNLDEPTPIMVDNDVFHSWEISKRTSRTLVAQLHSVANSDNLKYSILSGNERNWYRIDEDTGEIYTTSQYDHNLANNAELMCSSTTLSVRVEDNSFPYGGEDFCDIATVNLGELYYARVYDSHRSSNRSTRTVQRLENDASTALEDNKRSDYESLSDGGIVLAGYDSSMSVAVICLEVGVAEDAREHLMWRVAANNNCSLLTASSGYFSYSNTTSFVVAPSEVPNRRANQVDDLVIEIGFDSDSDGLLEDGEVLIVFQNAVIGLEEYKPCRNLLLEGYWGSYMASFPVARELLGYFMGRTSEGTYYTCAPYTLEYGAKDGGYSQSNGLGIDAPGLTSGSIDSYYWDTNSLFSQKICESEEFITAVIDAVYDEALSEATQYYDAHHGDGTDSYSIALSDVSVNLSYSGFNDLAMALGHCRAMLSGVIIYTRYVDDQIYFDGLSVMGRCSDLYDFKTLWDASGYSNLVDQFVAAASVVQIGHRYGARAEGEIFRVEAHLSSIYTPSFPVLLEDENSVINSIR